MKSKLFYPQCQYLDPNRRDSKGRFYCETLHWHVTPARHANIGPHRYTRFCASDCPDRSGKTRIPTL